MQNSSQGRDENAGVLLGAVILGSIIGAVCFFISYFLLERGFLNSFVLYATVGGVSFLISSLRRVVIYRGGILAGKKNVRFVSGENTTCE